MPQPAAERAAEWMKQLRRVMPALETQEDLQRPKGLKEPETSGPSAAAEQSEVMALAAMVTAAVKPLSEPAPQTARSFPAG